MTTEYWLQKKTIGGWSHVTWYAELEQAQINYDKLRQQAGYSYRLVKVETVQEHMLEEVVKVEAPSVELDAKANVWGGQKKPDVLIPKSEWGKAEGWGVKTGWGDLPSDSAKSEHGMVGKVWMINHQKKLRARVDAASVSAYEADGYERGGPKTAFRS